MYNIGFPFAIDVKTQKPLIPSRGPVLSKNQLIQANTWSYDIDQNGNKIFYVYPGMLIPVINSRDVYMLIDPEKILDEDYSGWAVISGVGGDFIYDGGDANDVYLTEQIMDAGTAKE